jgi:uncharacterized membrane protein
MNLTPLLEASPAIRLHTAVATAAVFAGAWLMVASRKGSPLHRAVGRAFLAFMLVTALSSLFIHQLNPGGPFGFSPVHLLILVTVHGVVSGYLAARRHDVVTHRRVMIRLYVLALLVAGALTFLPGRLLHAVAVGG